MGKDRKVVSDTFLWYSTFSIQVTSYPLTYLFCPLPDRRFIGTGTLAPQSFPGSLGSGLVRTPVPVGLPSPRTGDPISTGCHSGGLHTRDGVPSGV